jgi:hypothetical protein
MKRSFSATAAGSDGTARGYRDHWPSPPKVQLSVQLFLSRRRLALNSTDATPRFALGTSLRKGDEGGLREWRLAADAAIGAHRADMWASTTQLFSAQSLVCPARREASLEPALP